MFIRFVLLSTTNKEKYTERKGGISGLGGLMFEREGGGDQRAWGGLCLNGRGGISGLGSSGRAYVGKFHSKWSKFGTIVHLGSKTFFFKKGPFF